MNILVTNDDSIYAPGIAALVDILTSLPGTRVYVWAPDSQRSANAHAISTSKPILLYEADVLEHVECQWAISGTPVDCVKAGIKRLKSEEGIDIDLVFSGINHGSNLGTDVLYSGTVSAAAEGVLCGVPSVALSVGSSRPTPEMLKNFATIVEDICTRVYMLMDKKTLININFPDCPPEDIKGIKVARLGPREYIEKFDIQESPRGQKYYWYSGEMVHYEGLPEDIDVAAYQDGYITVTPMQLDLTAYEQRDKVSAWDLKYK